MATLKWSTSDAVFVTEIDDEHKEIFAAIADLEARLGTPNAGGRGVAKRLVGAISDHFAHEERLMRAARYHSLRWHKQLHDAARRRIRALMPRIEQGDVTAGLALIEYLTSWLPSHTQIADRMMGAALRNHERGICRLRIQASTRPAGSCQWMDITGDRFDPEAPRRTE